LCKTQYDRGIFDDSGGISPYRCHRGTKGGLRQFSGTCASYADRINMSHTSASPHIEVHCKQHQTCAPLLPCLLAISSTIGCCIS
jgi:hypothetical protein